jgi:hypothetical protein
VCVFFGIKGLSFSIIYTTTFLCHGHKNNQVHGIFLTKTRTNANLIPNPDHEKKKKTTTNAKQEFNKILLQKQNKNRTRL